MPEVVLARRTRAIGPHIGTGSLSGTVTDSSGAPAVREVVVSDHRSGVPVYKTYSAADGTWSATGLRVGLVVDVRFKDDDAGTVFNDLAHSKVTVA